MLLQFIKFFTLQSLYGSFASRLFLTKNLWSINVQFIGATMGSSELQIQTENGQIGMPSNICCVVVEYLPGGALKSYLIKNRRKKLAFKVVVQLALDLARGYPFPVFLLIFIISFFFLQSIVIRQI